MLTCVPVHVFEVIGRQPQDSQTRKSVFGPFGRFSDCDRAEIGAAWVFRANQTDRFIWKVSKYKEKSLVNVRDFLIW